MQITSDYTYPRETRATRSHKPTLPNLLLRSRYSVPTSSKLYKIVLVCRLTYLHIVCSVYEPTVSRYTNTIIPRLVRKRIAIVT